ncbi:MAG: hopanoid biosynthesis-associated RND transporter HpnN, partial [Candidatus Competibacterales bacterium]
GGFSPAGGGPPTAVGVLLVGGLGRVKDAAGVILALALALALTATALWLGGGAFNYANVIALPLLLGLGVDNGIHVLHRLRRGETLPLSRSSTARAVWFSALTTLASFATLMTSAHRGMASMGLVLTLGVIFTLFATLWVLPAYFPSPPPDK